MSDRSEGPCSPGHGDASESAQVLSDCPADGPEDVTGQAVKHRLSSPEASRYRARQLLGRGGMGRVIEVRDERLGRDIAMKVSHPQATTGADLDARLAREAWLMARLVHPGIVPLLDAGVGIDGRIYLTMPIVRGRTLADALSLAADRDARTRLLGHVLEACEAVAWAHEEGIVHCDLKPSNIMLCDGGGTRVLDWGLARVLAEDTPTTIVGTPQYMSPEQARGAPVEERSDVWSIGAMLYEVCTGRPLRAPGSVIEVLRGARTGRLEARFELVQDRCPELLAIVTRALADDPAERHADARALARELAACLDRVRHSATRPLPPRPLLARCFDSWRTSAVIASAALALGGVMIALDGPDTNGTAATCRPPDEVAER